MIKYFRIFFKLVEITIDISVFCHISSIFFFIFFFFSFDSLVVALLFWRCCHWDLNNNIGLWCNGSTEDFGSSDLGSNPDSLAYADVMERNTYQP